MTELPGWARSLDLAPHPEGGWYRETWRSDLVVGESTLPPTYCGSRNAGTAILFLLMPGQHQTIAANIANQFPEAAGLGVNVLIATGLMLFIITFLVNMAARAIIARRAEFSGAN